MKHNPLITEKNRIEFLDKKSYVFTSVRGGCIVLTPTRHRRYYLPCSIFWVHFKYEAAKVLEPYDTTSPENL